VGVGMDIWACWDDGMGWDFMGFLLMGATNAVVHGLASKVVGGK
jgi:hypothetical protein